MRRYVTAVVLSVASTLGVLAQGPEPRWEFRVDLDREVYFRQPDGQLYRGRLNIAGVFITDRFSPIVWERSGPRPEWGIFGINDPKSFPAIETYYQTERVYEFRAGTLVPGVLQYPGVFIAKEGGEVIGVNRYKPVVNGVKAPRIYNLPGVIVAAPADREAARFSGVPIYRQRSDWTRDGSVPEKLPEATHTFRPDYDRVVGVLRGKTVYAGKLTPNGDFVPELDLKPVGYDGKATVAFDRAGRPLPADVINHPRRLQEGVYELRGNTLVWGRLLEDGSFMCQSTAGMFDWGEYFPSRIHAREQSRIYNLPGTIVPIDEKEQ